MVEEVQNNQYHYSTNAEASLVMFGDFTPLAEELKTEMYAGQICLVIKSVERWDCTEKDKRRLSLALGTSLDQFELTIKDKAPAQNREMHELWVIKK